jgi:hypothetical protein
MGIWEAVVDPVVGWTGIRYGTMNLAGPRDEDDTVLEVPGYFQTESYTCGFTAGLMALHAFKPRSSASRFFRTVDPDRDDGVPTPKLVASLRAHGLGTRAMRTHTHDALAARIEAGEPVVTQVNNGQSYNHWVVVYGVRRGRDVFVAGNGVLGFGRSIYPWGEFRRVWRPRDGAFSCWGK